MYFHIWFVTKYRKALLEGETEEFVKNILAECVQRHNYEVLELETNKDHLHMLVGTKDKAQLAAMVRTLKAVSAKEVLRTQRFRVGKVKHFWAKRYGAREVEEKEIEGIREYVRNQKKYDTRSPMLPHGEREDTPHFRVGNVIPQAEACGHMTAKCPNVYIRTFG